MRIRRRPAPACVGPIDDIIVNKRRVMYEFDYSRKPDACWGNNSQHLGCEQQQGRPDTLSAAREQILADLGNRRNVGAGIALQLLFDQGKFRSDQLINLLRCLGHHTEAKFYDDFVPKRLRKLADVASAISCTGMPRSLAMNPAVSATKTGSFLFPR